MMPPPQFLPGGSEFHHVGVACKSLESEQGIMRGLGYKPVGEPFTDPRQGVTGVFLEGLGPRLELLAPLPDSDVLDPWLRSNAKLYHLAYLVQEMDRALWSAGSAGARQVSRAVPAVAFGDRRIAFLMLPDLLLVEFIEASPASE
jgi:methylmalonyl-CoA/ethylmalonyl-CoA epimerase